MKKHKVYFSKIVPWFSYSKKDFFVTFRKGLYCIAFLRVDYKSSSPKNEKGTSICLFNARSNCQSSSAKTNRTAITWYDRQSHETHSEDHGWPHGKIPFCNSLDYERSTSFRLSNHSEFRFLRNFLQGERFWKEKYIQLYRYCCRKFILSMGFGVASAISFHYSRWVNV